MTLQIAGLRLADVHSPYLEHVDLILTRKPNAGTGYVYPTRHFINLVYLNNAEEVEGIFLIFFDFFLMEKENSCGEVEAAKAN